MSLDKEFLKELTGEDVESAAFFNVYHKLRETITKPINSSGGKSANPFDLITAGSETDVPFMAGGSLVRYMLGKGQWKSDFDLWHCNAESKSYFRKQLDEYKSKTAVAVHSSTFEFPIGNRKVKVQSVNDIRSRIPDLLGEFDFTICQFAYMGDSQIRCTNIGLADFLNRRLRLTGKMKNPEYTKARMLKYMQMGFKPDEDMVKWLVDSSVPIGNIGSIVY